MKSEVQKIAVLGGSFDPVHFGHIDIVENLEKIFDRVIVMPSYVSPFKSGATDAAVRLRLCKKAFESEKTEVSRYEIAKMGVSYSVDTAAYLAKKYAGQKLFWVIGSEELVRLESWHDIDRLKTLVEFYVVPRPEFDIDETVVRSLKKRKIKLKTAKFSGVDISSTRIRIDMAFGKPNCYMPDFVYAYAVKNGLFNPYGKYAAALGNMINERRIEHTYRAAVRGAQLAKLYGANVNDAVIACILHDIGKDKPEKFENKVDTHGYPDKCAHAPIGAHIAKDVFDVSDEIAEAIRTHSTGDENMSLLGEIVYLADKTESGRKYKSFSYLCELCATDRALAMLYALREVNSLDGAEPNKYSKRALKYYSARCEGKEMPEEKTPSSVIHLGGSLPAIRASADISEIKTKSKAVSVARNKPAETKGEIAEKPSDKVKTETQSVKSEKAAPVSGFEPADDGQKQNLDIAETVAAELDLHKARDIDIIDISGKTVIADYFVIASASSTTAVKALCGYVEDILTKKYGLDPLKRDTDSEWVALDYGGVIVHVFTDRMREFYNIERLWSDGGNVLRRGD